LNFDISDEVEIKDEQLAFFVAWTGADNASEPAKAANRKHIIDSWLSVKSKFHTYRCIQSLSYLSPRSQRLEAYQLILDVLKKGEEAASSLKIADIGCCIGQDIRQLILHGVKPSCITAIDIHSGYWEAGLTLFKDDVCAEEVEGKGRLSKVRKCFFDMSLPMHAKGTIESTDFEAIESFDFVILQAVLHTQSLPSQTNTLKRIFDLLKSGKGVLLGATGGSEIATEWALTPDGKNSRYLHSIESLTTLLTSIGFKHISIKDKTGEWKDAMRGAAGGGGFGGGFGAGGDEGQKRLLLEFSAKA